MRPPCLGREALLGVLDRHYNGYCFSKGAAERVFNSDMVLYFLRELDNGGAYPGNMLDRNVRTEYAHLQRIGIASGVDAEARRALLLRILGEGGVRSGRRGAAGRRRQGPEAWARSARPTPSRRACQSELHPMVNGGSSGQECPRRDGYAGAPVCRRRRDTHTRSSTTENHEEAESSM